MNNQEIALLTCGLTVLGFFALLAGSILFRKVSDRVNYLKMEISRTDGEECRYWQRELKIYYLTLIPFMSYERAKRIVRHHKP